jgi:competence protein ComFA
LLAPFAPGGNYVHSKRAEREEIIADFKKGKYRYLVTTSVLERGVTIRDLQVIVTKADDQKIYTSSTLIQIAGRAGRKMDAPDGEVTFLAEKETEEIHDAIKEIQFCNTFL